MSDDCDHTTQSAQFLSVSSSIKYRVTGHVTDKRYRQEKGQYSVVQAGSTCKDMRYMHEGSTGMAGHVRGRAGQGSTSMEYMHVHDGGTNGREVQEGGREVRAETWHGRAGSHEVAAGPTCL